MKKLLAAAALLLVPAAALAQNANRVYTSPGVPSREALDRLHLKMAWRAYVPTDHRRDGLYSVQLVDDQIFVQTRSGTVVALNARDGVVQWQTTFDVPYRTNHGLGHNAKLLFATRAATLYGIDRYSGQVAWSLPLPGGPSAAAAADDERVFVPLGTGQLYAYEIPQPAKKKEVIKAENETKEDEKIRLADEAARAQLKAELDAERKRDAYSAFGVRGQQFTSIAKDFAVSGQGNRVGQGPQPALLWEFKAPSRLEQTPLLTDEHVVLACQDGTFIVTAKTHLLSKPVTFEAGGALAAPLGHYAILGDDEHIVEIAYVASADNKLFALDTTKGRIDWRFLAGGPITSRPMVTDEDIYVTADPAGLYRLDRKSGRELWRNRQAARFLAMNPKFVYAIDAQGNLLVLDRARGLVRGSYDTHNLVIPVANEATDRLFLANHDGLIVCLHDRDYPTPLKNKTVPVKKPAETKPSDEPAEKKK